MSLDRLPVSDGVALRTNPGVGGVPTSLNWRGAGMVTLLDMNLTIHYVTGGRD